MTPEDAYIACRKRAYKRWSGPERHYSYEDIAHDAWLRWMDNQHMAPYVIVDLTIATWWQDNLRQKNSISKTKTISSLTDKHTDDDPSGYASATEQLAVVLELVMKSSRKASVDHVAGLLLQGYTTPEIQATNDYEKFFINNVKSKIHSLMSPELRDATLVKKSHGLRGEYVTRNRHRLNARRSRYL